MKAIRHTGARLLALATLLLVVVTPYGYAQHDDSAPPELCIARIDRVESGTAEIDDGTVTYSVTWRTKVGENDVVVPELELFRVYCSPDSSFPDLTTERREMRVANGGNFRVLFENLPGNQHYYFKVFGISGGQSIMESSLGVKPWVDPVGAKQRPLGLAWVLLWPLEEVRLLPGGMKACRTASPLGWTAFQAIGLFLIVGLVFWLTRAWPRLRSTRIFLINKEVKGQNEIDAVLSTLDKQGLKLPGNGLRQMVANRLSRRSFHGTFLGAISKIAFWEWTAGRRANNRERMRGVAAVRILDTALSAVKNRSDIETALEVRIAAEEEELRKGSFLDVLWAFGVTAPLLGLFGTVTGLSEAFAGLASSSAKEVLPAQLASGIHEALYTTICGLVVGILFMMAFYYYQYKLDRVHAIWTTFAARFIDVVKYNGQGHSTASGSDSKE